MNFKASILTFLFFLFVCNLTAQITFAPLQTIVNCNFYNVVAIGDLNNDSLNDIAMGNHFFAPTPYDTSLFIFYQNSSGNLNTPILYSYPKQYPGVMAIDIGDLNNDQLNDIVIGFGDSIGIFYQNQLHNFNPIKSYYCGSNVDGVKIGDLNHDGLNDIAASNWLSNYIRIYNQTTTDFTSYTYSKPQSGFDEIDIGDVNNDGLDDVVLMAGGSNTSLHVFLQNASSDSLNVSINYFPAISGFGMAGIAIGDVNNDGRNDVVASKGGNQFASQIYLFLQDTITGFLQNPDSLPSYDIPVPIEIVDIDCDGRNEIVTGHNGWYKISLYEQNSQNQFTTYTLFPTSFGSYRPQSLCIGDINNDGRKDVITGDNGLHILLNNTPLPISSFTSRDTLISRDTISHVTFQTSSLYFNRTVFNTDSTCLIVQMDSFKIAQNFSADTIRLDTNIINSVVICSLYKDTVTHSHTYFSNTLTSIDTLLIYTHKDTIETTLTVKDTIVHLTNYFTDTLRKESILTIEKEIESSSGCSIIRNDFYRIITLVIIDSLKADSIFIKSAMTCGIIRTDTLHKLEKFQAESIISSDTLFISSESDTSITQTPGETDFCHLLNLYPSPTSKNITVEITNLCFLLSNIQPLRLELYDVDSRLVFFEKYARIQNPIKIDMSNYANGVYVLKTSLENNVCIIKVVVAK